MKHCGNRFSCCILQCRVVVMFVLIAAAIALTVVSFLWVVRRAGWSLTFLDTSLCVAQDRGSGRALQTRVLTSLMELNHAKPHKRRPKRSARLSHDRRTSGCPTPNSPACSPTDNCGKFFVLCFHPVTFPRALYTQVTQVSAHETMVTAYSGSVRGRHWKSWGLGPPGTVQTHFPHSGNRKA